MLPPLSLASFYLAWAFFLFLLLKSVSSSPKSLNLSILFCTGQNMQLAISDCYLVTCGLFGQLIFNAAVYYTVCITAIIMSKLLDKL